MKNLKSFFKTLHLTFLVFCLLTSSQAFGEKKKLISKGFFSLGNLSLYPRKVQIDTNGTTEDFNFNPYFSFGLEYPWNKSWSFYPEAGLAFTGNGRHSAISRYGLFLLGDIGYRWKDFTFQTGLGLYWTLLDGDGGTQSLNNGNSTTNFYIPEFTSISSNLNLNLGFSYPIGQLFNFISLNLKIDSSVYNITNSLKRAISYRVGLQYFFRQKLLDSYFNKD